MEITSDHGRIGPFGWVNSKDAEIRLTSGDIMWGTARCRIWGCFALPGRMLVVPGVEVVA
jgi:hypothetical protein